MTGRPCQKMATILFLVVNSIKYVTPHVEYSFTDFSEEEPAKKPYRRLDNTVVTKKQQFEGLPIEYNQQVMQAANEIVTPETTQSTTTTATTKRLVLDRRFRRIYNPDEVATIEEFPYMAALLVNNELWCGAVIIDRDKILTAAHCLQLQYNNRFFREYVKMLTVRVGSTNATSGGELLRVTEIFFHPNYKPQTLEFNYAVLKIHKNMTFGRKDPLIEKINFARDRIVPVDNQIIFLGWGSVLGIDGAGGQVLLQKVTLPVYDTADCQEVYGKELVTRSNFCAGFITIPKNVCNHDAGGPAVMDGELIGVLSFSSKRCDQADQPAVFSTVGTIATWLDKIGEKKNKPKSSRASYGDDAVSYVQLMRDGKLCTVKCKICPEHKVHAKLYGCTLVVNEDEEVILSVVCQDCVASQGGCKHAIAFLMWVHRRSEEPSCTSVECYWKKSKLSRVGSSLKYKTTKDLSKGIPILPANSSVLLKFLAEGRKRKVKNCELLKFQPTYYQMETEAVSMHQLVFKIKEKNVDLFVENVQISECLVKLVEKETREQSKSSLWFELRYGRITASKAFEVSRCKTNDGTLISLILGGKIPDTAPVKRGRILEDEVKKTVERKLKKKINKCGLILNSKYPMIAGSPDGIFKDSVIEIKCPVSAKTYENYIKKGEATEKYNAQMQLQMYLTGKKNCYFCVADPDYAQNNKVEILSVPYNPEYVENLIIKLLNFWKINVYPLLYQSVEYSSTL